MSEQLSPAHTFGIQWVWGKTQTFLEEMGRLDFTALVGWDTRVDSTLPYLFIFSTNPALAGTSLLHWLLPAPPAPLF